jgi:hypothetical protein
MVRVKTFALTFTIDHAGMGRCALASASRVSYSIPMNRRRLILAARVAVVAMGAAWWYGMDRLSVEEGRLLGTFVSRSDPGDKWGGKKRQLDRLVNPQDISRLVVFDTWTRNQDRYFPRPNGPPRMNLGNVFLSEDAPKGLLLLRAIDHTHAFTNGREIIASHLAVDAIQDRTVFGCFPEFRPFLDEVVVRWAAGDLLRIDRETVDELVDAIPQGMGRGRRRASSISQFHRRPGQFSGGLGAL